MSKEFEESLYQEEYKCLCHLHTIFNIGKCKCAYKEAKCTMSALSNYSCLIQHRIRVKVQESIYMHLYLLENTLYIQPHPLKLVTILCHPHIMNHGGHGKVSYLHHTPSSMIMLLEDPEHPPICGYLLMPSPHYCSLKRMATVVYEQNHHQI